MGSGGTTTVDVWTLLKAFRTCPWDLPVSLLKVSHGKNQNFWTWDSSLHIPDCQQFWITECHIKGILIYIYTGCPRRNGHNFGRVFLKLNYTDITQNTYIQSWTVMEIMARERYGLLAGSTYCTCTAGWHVTLISHVLESVTHASSQWVGVVSALLAYREWRCGKLYMCMCGFCNVWVCIYGFCNVCVLVTCIPALFGYPDWGFSMLFPQL